MQVAQHLAGPWPWTVMELDQGQPQPGPWQLPSSSAPAVTCAGSHWMETSRSQKTQVPQLLSTPGREQGGWSTGLRGRGVAPSGRWASFCSRGRLPGAD